MEKVVDFPDLCKKLWIKGFVMAISVSDSVYTEVQGKVADHAGAVQLIQNQLAAAQGSLGEWQAILAELAPPAAPAQPADVAGI